MNKGNDSIQSQGGKARAEKLSAEKIKEIAAKGALARWGAKATHKGNFEEEFGVDVDCYVLNDSLKTAVISQRGMARALGLSAGSGNSLPRFLSSKAMQSAGAGLLDKMSQPIKFQWVSPGAGQPPGDIYGFDVTLVIDLCRAILEVESQLTSQQQGVAKQAHIILNASAKAGIKGLVYALAGYNPSAEEVIAAFKYYVQEEAKKYEKEFPPELYLQWHRLYNIPVYVRGRSWSFKKLTVENIYYPLAKSNGKILQLVKANKARGGDRQAKLFQFLNETGTRALRMHLGRVLEMAESSKSKAEYEKKIVERFGGQQELDLIMQEQPPEPEITTDI